MAARPLPKQIVETLPGVVARTFQQMEIAEEVIKEKGERPGIFKVMQPGPFLEGVTDEVFRYHCRELADRVHAGGDTRVATKAEVLHLLSRTSLDAPLNASGLALYECLFHEAFPNKDIGPDLGREAWPGELDQSLSDARRKIFSPHRTVK